MPEFVPSPASASYLPDTVLTIEQLAVALSTSEQSIRRAGFEASYELGPQQPRFIWKHVIAKLEKGLRAA